jgi:hypothetical protein
MKRKVDFNIGSEKYEFIEDGNVIFQIDKSNMQFDVKAFYEAFFGDDKEYADIELMDPDISDSQGKRVWDTTSDLLKKIIDKMNQLNKTEK